MWHEGRAAFLFETAGGIALGIVIVLCVKSALICWMQRRAETKQDEHAQHLGIG